MHGARTAALQLLGRDSINLPIAFAPLKLKTHHSIWPIIGHFIPSNSKCTPAESDSTRRVLLLKSLGTSIKSSNFATQYDF